MLIIAKIVGKILAILNSEISPRQIAAGFAYGAILGFLPVSGLLFFLLLLISFIININLAIMFLSVALFKVISFLVDPIANQIGYHVLTAGFLKGIWTSFYNTPFIPFTRFNNTLVMGSLILGILLLVPNYFIGKWLVSAYRERFRDRIAKMKIVQVFKASTVYRWYMKYQGLKGDL